MGAFLIFLAAVVGVMILIFIIWSLINITVVRQKEAMIVERYGRFHACWGAGFHWLVPMLDRPRKMVWRKLEVEGNGRLNLSESYLSRLDLRQRVMNFQMQTIITRDNVEIGVHPMLFFELVDPVRIVYEVKYEY